MITINITKMYKLGSFLVHKYQGREDSNLLINFTQKFLHLMIEPNSSVILSITLNHIKIS